MGKLEQIALDTEYKRVLRHESWSRAKRMKMLYLLLIPPIILLVLFKYLPMYGIIIAFKDYRYVDGFWGSAWNNFYHFKIIVKDPFFGRVLRNTVIISLYRIIFGFPMPVILALLLNEIRSIAYKKVVQSVSYLPHFISWVILAGIFIEILSPQRGVVAYIFQLLGSKPINFLTNKPTFRSLIVVTWIWQSIGWNAVIYLAALSSIDPGLYESASMDGANRFHKAIYITIPSLIPVMTILFILGLGSILKAGFEQIFNLYNPLVYEVADVIDTYIYRLGIIQARYDFSAAVGLFKNIVGLILIIMANMIIKRFSEYGIW